MNPVCDQTRALYDDWRAAASGPAATGDAAAGQAEHAESERLAVDAHVATCAGCRRWFERQARLDGDLQSLAAAAERIVEAAPNVQAGAGRRQDAAMHARAPRVRTTALVRSGRIAAAVALTAGLIWIALPRSGRPAPPRFAGNPRGAERVQDSPAPTQSATPPVQLASVDSSALRVDSPGCWAVRLPSKDPNIRVIWLYDSGTREQSPMAPGPPPG